MKNGDHQFLSCDWGTSSFRLRLVEASQNAVECSLSTDMGIKKCFEAWHRQNGKRDRQSFYISYLQSQIQLLAR